VLKVPADLAPERLASLELAMCVGTCFMMLSGMGAIEGRRFGVNGLGPAGLVALQMARAEGAAEVYGFDPVAERRDHALEVGADACADPTADISAEFPSRQTAAPRLHTSIDCHGGRAAVQGVMDRTEDAVALFGVQREDYTYALHHGGIRLCGYKGHSKESARYALGLIEAGKLDLSPLVSVHLPLERYGEGIEMLEKQQALKIGFRPWD
jgi:threonine dehydrogenase-like Zn-dependent dehydrogenase